MSGLVTQSTSSCGASTGSVPVATNTACDAQKHASWCDTARQATPHHQHLGCIISSLRCLSTPSTAHTCACPRRAPRIHVPVHVEHRAYMCRILCWATSLLQVRASLLQVRASLFQVREKQAQRAERRRISENQRRFRNAVALNSVFNAIIAVETNTNSGRN